MGEKEKADDKGDRLIVMSQTVNIVRICCVKGLVFNTDKFNTVCIAWSQPA